MTKESEPTGPLPRLYPEVAVGGYARHDGFVDFFTRAGAVLEPGSDVLDFGAGRGEWADGSLSAHHRRVRDFRAAGHRVVGVDVDPVVLTNPTLDESHLIVPGEPLPFADQSFDLVVADHVLEHIEEPHAASVATEVHRVIRPGGWFAARTPNRWGIIGVGARMVPNRFHVAVLERLQPGRQARDVFPTQYHMNSRRDLRRLFPAPRWDLYLYGHASEPQYAGSSVTAWRAAALLDRLTPTPMAPTLMIFARRRR